MKVKEFVLFEAEGRYRTGIDALVKTLFREIISLLMFPIIYLFPWRKILIFGWQRDHQSQLLSEYSDVNLNVLLTGVIFTIKVNEGSKLW